MPIIRGDETVEERLAALKDKTDINSMAERVRLKQAGTKMPIVQDDSLGTGVSRTATPLNAGQTLPTREVVEAKSEEAKAMADARKKEAETKRKQEPEAVVGIEMGENDSDASKEDEIATLKAKIASLEAENQKPTAMRRPVKTPDRAKEIVDKQ